MLRILLFLLLTLPSVARSQSSLYYPPLTGGAWDTVSPTTLGWCPDRIDSLYNFLQAKHTKAFIVLKDGRIVLERYFGTFTADSFHHWASAGKTLTAFAVGIAQEEGLLNISDPTSDYLGTGWTSAPAPKEALITIRHQLSMTTGLDDGMADLDCTDPACLSYLADAGTRWAYHNAPYTLLQRVVDSAAGPQTWGQFYNTRIAQKTGINGLWVSTSGYNSVFFSRPHAAARFGLLMLGRGVWNGDPVLGDTAYIGAMTRASQSLNLGYGYLTWLNGSATYMLPPTQLVFTGPLVPAAPADMYAALGKDDQKIHVVPSMGLVVVRMGDAADSSRLAPSAFDNEMWGKLSAAMCSAAGLEGLQRKEDAWKLFPQPAYNALHVAGLDPGAREIFVYDLAGRCMLRALVVSAAATLYVENLAAGQYVLSDGTRSQLFSKQ